MVNKQKIILFDIDNTLLSGDAYRDALFSALARVSSQDEEQFKKIAASEYFDMRKAGPFIPSEFAKRIAKKLSLKIYPQDIEKVIFDERLMRKSMFEETEEVLKKLSEKKEYTLGIFSSGPYEFQRAKIHAIEEYFHKDHINIYLFKEDQLKETLEKYTQYEVSLIDDLLQILYNAKAIKENIYTVWIRRGWVAKEQKPIAGFSPDKTITNLREILPLFEK